jgi:hypothetical protein
MVYYDRQIFETKFPNFNPPHHEVAIKYSPINIKLCSHLTLTLTTSAHHYIYHLDHQYTCPLFLYVMTVCVKYKWKNARRELD